MSDPAWNDGEYYIGFDDEGDPVLIEIPESVT